MFVPDTLFRIATVILLALNLTISGYYRRKANQAGGDLDPSGNRLLAILRIGTLLLLIPFLGNLINPSWFTWTKVSLPIWLRWLGLGVTILSVPAIYWLFSTIGSNISPSHTTRKDHALITSGPYSYIRHPLYTFGFMAYVGIGLMNASWWLLIALMIMFSILAYRTPLEEEALTKEFGKKYIAYKAQTGRYFPKLMK